MALAKAARQSGSSPILDVGSATNVDVLGSPVAITPS